MRFEAEGAAAARAKHAGKDFFQPFFFLEITSELRAEFRKSEDEPPAVRARKQPENTKTRGKHENERRNTKTGIPLGNLPGDELAGRRSEASHRDSELIANWDSDICLRTAVPGIVGGRLVLSKFFWFYPSSPASIGVGLGLSGFVWFHRLVNLGLPWLVEIHESC